MNEPLSRRATLLLGAAAAVTPFAAHSQPIARAPESEGWAALPEIALWPEAAIAAERIHTPRDPSPMLPESYRSAALVDRPTIRPYRPAKPNGAAIIFCAGGGYIVVGQSAGPPAWLAKHGFWVFDLRYRLPGGGWRAGPDASLQDAQQAIRLVRSRAAEWDIDPARIGVAGFSAGGHIASSAATRHAEDLDPPSRTYSQVDARPSFALLGCPVITMYPPSRHGASVLALFGRLPTEVEMAARSPERLVNAKTPPCFLAHAADDRVVPPANSIGMFEALRKAGVEAELHIYSRGGHDMGKGFLPDTSVSSFPSLFIEFLKRAGLVSG